MTYLVLIVAAVLAASLGPLGWAAFALWMMVLGTLALWPRPLVYGLADKPLKLRRVIDGDTFEVDAPAGSPAHLGGVVSVRLRGCDAIELAEPGGEVARRILATFLKRGRIFCEDVGSEKYGRALATVRVKGKDAALHLIEHGVAVPYSGGPR